MMYRINFKRDDDEQSRADRLCAVLARTGCLSWRGIQRRVTRATGVVLTESQIRGRIMKAGIRITDIRNAVNGDPIQAAILGDRAIIARATTLIIQAQTGRS